MPSFLYTLMVVHFNALYFAKDNAGVASAASVKVTEFFCVHRIAPKVVKRGVGNRMFKQPQI